MSVGANAWIWFGFSIFIIIALSVDTFLFSKKHARVHESFRMALSWSLIWVLCALIFNGLLWIYLYYTANLHVADEIALDFLTGYLIEITLSIDNLFAFYLIFEQLQIQNANQQRIFSYGIWSAIILRLLLILFGTWLVIHFHWILYLMGVFLMLTGVKMMFVSHKKNDLKTSRLFKWLKRCIRITDEFHGQRFFIRKVEIPAEGVQGEASLRGAFFATKQSRNDTHTLDCFVAKNAPRNDGTIRKDYLYATPLFIALIFIEACDLIFAFDSIPAIFAITTDPFIVWASNIFAIIGLRAMYFLLSGMIVRFHLLKYGVALILVFVGLKMVIAPWTGISVGLSLGIISGILLLFTGLSMVIRPNKATPF